MAKSPVFKISTDGDREYLEDKHPTLEELQAAVGGYIETVRIDSKTLMIVDEEGLVKSKTHNRTASMLVGRHIAGDVVVMPESYLD